MKLKQLTSDFVVEELSSLEFSKDERDHSVYVMEKKEVDTFDAIRTLAQKLRVPLFEIGYAGLKDKHAWTRQYVSIPTHYHIRDTTVENITLKHIGFHQKKIQIGDLNGNTFTIIVRDIKENELSDIASRARTLPTDGVPNYFDSQRFGSVFEGDFVIKHVMKKQYEEAVKSYLTQYLKSEPKRIKDEKRRIKASWGHLEALSIRTKPLARIIHEYHATHNWNSAYKKIPAHLREMHVNAYQSFLWNECVKEVLKTCILKERLYPIKYAAGSLLFYTQLYPEERLRIPKTFLTISESASFTSDEQRIMKKILGYQNVSLTDFAIEQQTGNFFKARPRDVLLIPEQFRLGLAEDDELNSSKHTPRFKVCVSLQLPKGSYATLITKRLFGH